MAREKKFQRFRLEASIAIIGILCTFAPTVSAQDSSYYTPAKYEADGVVSRYEVKTVVKYYDKTTGYAIKQEEITNLENVNVVEEKQLIPHYYSTVAKYNAQPEENPSVKYYQWGKSAETSHLLFEVSNNEGADLVANYQPQRPNLQQTQALQQSQPAPQIRQNVTYLTKEQIRDYEMAQKEKAELAKQSLKTPKQLAKEAKEEQHLRVQQERKLIKINKQAEIQSKKVKIEAQKAELKAKRETDAQYKSIAKEIKQGEKIKLAEERKQAKETKMITIQEKEELKATLKQQKIATEKERKRLIQQEKANLKAERKAERLQQQESKTVLKTMAKKLQEADNEKLIQQKAAEKQAQESLKAQQKLEKEQANSKKRLEKELAKSRKQVSKPKETNLNNGKLQGKYAPVDNGYKVYQGPQFVNTDKTNIDLKGKRLNVNIPIQLRKQSNNNSDKTIIKTISEEYKYKNTSRTANAGVFRYNK